MTRKQRRRKLKMRRQQRKRKFRMKRMKRRGRFRKRRMHWLRRKGILDPQPEHQLQ